MSEEMQQAIETALLAAAAKTPFSSIDLAEVATAAGVGLADLRRLYDGPLDVLASFTRRIDVGVLAGVDPSLATEPVRERLFDASMRRFDLLAPHRAGLAGLHRSARRDPLLALTSVRLVVGSQAWVLRAAGLSSGGLLGRARAAALAVAIGRVVPVFLEETDSGLPKTMAALDEVLKKLEGLAEKVRGAESRLGRWCRPAPSGVPEAETAEAGGSPG